MCVCVCVCVRVGLLPGVSTLLPVFQAQSDLAFVERVQRFTFRIARVASLTSKRKSSVTKTARRGYLCVGFVSVAKRTNTRFSGVFRWSLRGYMFCWPHFSYNNSCLSQASLALDKARDAEELRSFGKLMNLDSSRFTAEEISQLNCQTGVLRAAVPNSGPLLWGHQENHKKYQEFSLRPSWGEQ